MAGSSIKTRIVSAAAIDATFAFNTGRHAAVFLEKNNIHENLISNKLLDQLKLSPSQIRLKSMLL